MNQRKTTVGIILKEAREAKFLTFKDVSQQTRIHPQFLAALESGEYSVFSSAVHIKGFLRTYALFLGVDPERVLAFFRREYSHLSTQEQGLQKLQRSLGVPRLYITPALLTAVVSLAFVLFFFGYLFIRYRQFSGAPLLYIEQPLAERVEVTDATVTLAGRSDPDAQVSINGQRITIGEEGQFSTTITLSEGVTVLHVVARNTLDKERTVSKTFVYKASEPSHDSSSPPISPSPAKGVSLEVSIGPHAAWVSLLVDGATAFEGILGPGVVKKITAEREIKITSGNAGSTKVSVNGAPAEILGAEGAVLDKLFKALPEAPIPVESTPSGEQVD